ncbi:hypothetical protein DICPUDRAFT_35425 [Dictyostelium purpureum]|uniref:Transmembrane protein n=1 Tax=Dictyostelium purpureum TaxID=5786 RepID=F0ZPB3_DICPU|nr:uncharacterized protein DICPUDRAFT_35425 [Dictyostelium purpureum]EGC34213.1 hypothetical protein DICPUDRAFT_35425 [Dictyostelium purpureum]|eukprot:XP_003289265.1 hypothetical protein DICPUDRAFT_35425 [Dictyostelium purpureum]
MKSFNKTKIKVILKNVVDLGLNQNKYLIQSDKKVLFCQQTTFKNDYSTQFQHILSRQEYSKIIETLNSNIDPMLFKLQVNNWLLLIAIIMFPCIIVTSIFASMGKIFIPTIVVGALSCFIGIFAIFRKNFLDSKLSDKVTKDIQTFNNRFSHRQISLEYLVTTIYSQNRISYQINLHLIYPIIAAHTPGMYSSSQYPPVILAQAPQMYYNAPQQQQQQQQPLQPQYQTVPVYVSQQQQQQQPLQQQYYQQQQPQSYLNNVDNNN